jgi:excisionase family DNA binding protein
VTADDRERLLTTGEAAAVLGGTDTTVKRWVRTGMLASVATPGGHRRYRPADVERLNVLRMTAKHEGPKPRRVHTPPSRGGTGGC